MGDRKPDPHDLRQDAVKPCWHEMLTAALNGGISTGQPLESFFDHFENNKKETRA